MWNEHNCMLIWTFCSIAFLWDWNDKWLFPLLGSLLSFPNLLAYWVYDYFNVWLCSVCQYFVEDIYFWVHERCWFVMCVCVCELSLPGSDIWVTLTLKNGLRSIASSSALRKYLWIVIKSLSVLLNLSVKPYGPKLLFWGRFLNTVAISLLVISLFGFF